MMSLAIRLCLVASMAVAAGGCDLSSFRLGAESGDGGVGDGDGGVIDGDGGTGDGDGGTGDGDGGIPGCVPALEICDGMDNDCDGTVDNGFDLQNDPGNCGTCGFTCDRPNSSGSCVAGGCEFSCLPGYHDLDMTNPADGCEYFCIETNGGVEQCDITDNDCDGVVDNGIDTNTDVNNCGSCGRVCDAATLHATPLCNAGTCDFVPGTCAVGFNDINPAIPGCEYACPDGDVGGPELCNGIDDDCDGVADETVTDPLVGINCFADDPTGGPGAKYDQGECGANPGTSVCTFGNVTCPDPTLPSAEICDGLDNDCDGGAPDEGFDTNTDVNNCGTCGFQCNITNAVPQCVGGSCSILACKTGFHDDPDIPGADCLYACTVTGAEVCDGIDNDCDKLTDTADPGLIIPPDFCSNLGDCATHTLECSAEVAGPSCTDADPTITWRCQYPNTEATCGGFRLPLQETLCDDLDGDCDNATDETYLDKGDFCDTSATDVGECIETGTRVCDTMSQTATVCNLTGGGTGNPAGPDPCDNKDNNCNGMTDEDPDTSSTLASQGFDAMVEISDPAIGTFSIYRFEASRPDADNTSGGGSGARACSKPDSIPWRNVTWQEAEDACVAAGLRLCTAGEWQAACGGTGAACSVRADECPAGDYCSDAMMNSICDENSTLNAGGPCLSDADCDAGSCVPDLIEPAAGTKICINGSDVNVAGPCNSDDDCDNVPPCDPTDGGCFGHCQPAIGWCAPGSDANSGGLCNSDFECDNGTNGCGSGENGCRDKCQPVKRCAAGSQANEGGICLTDDDCDSNTCSGPSETDCFGKCGPIGLCSQSYPYGGTYDAFACNGHDYDVTVDASCQLSQNVDEVLPTGADYGCNADTSCASAVGDNSAAATVGVLDLSGNLKEWTADVEAGSATVLGGSYDNEAQALSCEFDFTTLDTSFAFPNLGFRCCKDGGLP